MSTEITPKHSTTYEPGAILCDKWGWEQTNVEFYCVVKMSGDWVTVAPMTKISTPNGEAWSMTTKEAPGVIDTDKPTIRKKLKRFNGELSGFSFRNYAGGGWCELWKGSPQFASHYA